VRIIYDPAKRETTLRERGLDFGDATEVFAGREITRLDTREDYGMLLLRKPAPSQCSSARP